MITLTNDFRDFIQILNDHRVKYLIIGAYSMTNYGYIRATGDFDIWLDATLENAHRVVNALNKFGFNFDDELVNQLAQPQKRLVIGNPPSQIDLMTSIDGVTFEKAYENRNVSTDKNLKLNIIAIDDLIRNKESTNRLKDKADAEELRKRN